VAAQAKALAGAASGDLDRAKKAGEEGFQLLKEAHERGEAEILLRIVLAQVSWLQGNLEQMVLLEGSSQARSSSSYSPARRRRPPLALSSALPSAPPPMLPPRSRREGRPAGVLGGMPGAIRGVACSFAQGFRRPP
jgi:hypothetical protein